MSNTAMLPAFLSDYLTDQDLAALLGVLEASGYEGWRVDMRIQFQTAERTDDQGIVYRWMKLWLHHLDGRTCEVSMRRPRDGDRWSPIAVREGDR